MLVGAAAMLWPSRIVGPLDGIPLDQPSDALGIGLLIPVLWWLSRGEDLTRWGRILVVALLVWKVAGVVVLRQQGLCAASFAGQPWGGTTQTIRVSEPSGALRSWDVRADWRDAVPRCTAILTRPLGDTRAFPAWFVNITDQMMGHRDFTMTIRGYITIDEPGTLRWGTGDVTGSDESSAVRLDRGTHAIEHVIKLSEKEWRFEPTLDDEPLWRGALITVDEPRAVDRWVAPWAWIVTPAMVVAIAAALALRSWRTLAPTAALGAWTAAAVAGSVVLALTGPLASRAAGLVAFAGCAVPMPTRLRNVRGAFLLVGIPWLAFFAVWGRGQIGRFSIYSYDDWLAYQVAGYRIFVNGYWLEAGTLTFDYQPLYRWISGILHLLFGDSSVGELYLDAAALLCGALLAFWLVKARTGFRWGLVAAAAVLTTFTIGTPWYFIGRGLSEIGAAGLSFLAIFFLLRGRRGSAAWTAAAALMAVLMFYARLNHLLWAPFLAAFFLPMRTPAVPDALWSSVRRVRPVRVGLFAAVFAVGVLFVVLRTWYYTGEFSLFYGTSLRHNDTGLRPWTIFDAAVWGKVGHGLASFVTLVEPPRPDPRSFAMVAGVVAWTVAVVHPATARRMPAALIVGAAGAAIGVFFAHAHPYPGRFSIHAVPLASAIAVIAMRPLVRGPLARMVARASPSRRNNPVT